MLKLLLKPVAAASLMALPGGIAAHAAPAPAISTAKDMLAVGGYDATGYFTAGKPVVGSRLYELQFAGATWRFASQQSLARFKANPGAYAPQFGGYCAWAVSQGYLAPGDPKQWKIVKGKLYLNANARAKMLWERDQTDAIVRGHANWPSVLEKNQDRP